MFCISTSAGKGFLFSFFFMAFSFFRHIFLSSIHQTGHPLPAGSRSKCWHCKPTSLDLLFHHDVLQLLSGNMEAFSHRPEYTFLKQVLGLPRGLHPVKHLPWEGSGGHLDLPETPGLCQNMFLTLSGFLSFAASLES